VLGLALCLSPDGILASLSGSSPHFSSAWQRRAIGMCRPTDQSALALAAAACLLVVGCSNVEKRVRPSHFRDWVPEQAVLPRVELRGSQATIRNVRNCQYFANDVYLVDYYDKAFDLNAVCGVDFIVVPFAGMPALAHTMLSFHIAGPDGKTDYLAVSVETRKEIGETYNPVKGAARQYELIYVLADERDVVQYRTNFNGEDVHLYRSTATPEAARLMLLDVLERVNQIARQPEFYDTLTNNCTTNIVGHINHIRPNRLLAADPRLLLSGYADELAYQQGLIERRGTFLETKQQAYVNPLAHRYAGREDFSEMIRRQ
jgi:hypothetical protein